MNGTRLLTTMAVFVAIGTLGSQILWFPAGVAKAYPVQHAINVLAAVILGSGPGVLIVFMIGMLRNLLGLGSLLAFPRGMIGAFMAGYLYKRTGKKENAAFGEIIGTAVVGSLFAVPFAKLFMGTSVGAFFFFPSFLVSSLSGSLIGLFIVSRIKQTGTVQHFSSLK